LKVAVKKRGWYLTACPHCAAREGQLHQWNCSHERCPFCGSMGMECECSYKLDEAVLHPGLRRLPRGMTAAHVERWRELAGGLLAQRMELMDCPFEEQDLYLETPPDWCRSAEQLRAFWRVQRKYMEMEAMLDGKWKVLCSEYGRVPQVHLPQMCAACGALEPEMFMVPDDEWRKYVVPELQGEMICIDCYNRYKLLFPQGWRKAKEARPHGG